MRKFDRYFKIYTILTLKKSYHLLNLWRCPKHITTDEQNYAIHINKSHRTLLSNSMDFDSSWILLYPIIKYEFT